MWLRLRDLRWGYRSGYLGGFRLIRFLKEIIFFIVVSGRRDYGRRVREI